MKLIVILGPTGSGKTDVAIRLAEKYNGEIVCADSRTVYRGMDIGTAKPSYEERARVPHHLLDVIDPSQTMSAAEFKDLADTAINEIWAKGKQPFLVGGSGLYIDAVVYEFEFPRTGDQTARDRLNALSDNELIEELTEVDPDSLAVIDLANRRRVIRAIETAGLPRARRETVRPNTLVIGIDKGRDELRERLELRVQAMIEEGLLDEVRAIGEQYGHDCPGLKVMGYNVFRNVVYGTMTADEARSEMLKQHVSLTKKQRTWFRHIIETRWVDALNQADELAREFVAADMDKI